MTAKISVLEHYILVEPSPGLNYWDILEAASKVSKECRLGCEPIPWDIVIDLKEQVVHTYWDIDRDWIWKTVTEELPPIISALDQLVPSGAD